MEPEGSLPCSQEPSTGPYPEPDQSVSVLSDTILSSAWKEIRKHSKIPDLFFILFSKCSIRDHSSTLVTKLLS
jgi:hypothetical protein